MNKSIVRSSVISLIIILSGSCLESAPVVVSGGPDNDYESWIARLQDGRLMVVFDRNPDWASGDLYVSFSTDDGNTWSAPVSIIAGAGDQATLSFVQMPDDTIRLWYASNESGNYGIYAAWSVNGLNWTLEGRIDLGWGAGDMHYDPTVILEPDSSLTMSYRGPGGAFVAHQPYRGDWDTLKTMAGAAGNRPRIMKHTNGTYLLAYQRRSGSSSSNIDVFVRTSTDRIAWSDSVRLTTNMNSHDAFAAQAPDGAYMVYYGKYVSPAYNLKRRKSFDAVSWQAEETVTSDAVYNLQPHLFVENNDIYLVWAHEIDYETDNDVYFEKTPYLAVQDGAPAGYRTAPVTIAPDPCARSLVISAAGLDDGLLELTVYDLSGQLVRRLEPAARSFVLDVSSYPSGIYFVEVKTPQGRMTSKFVVSR